MSRGGLILAGVWLLGAGMLEAEEKAPPPRPDFTASAQLAEKMPRTVSGFVFLDGRPLAGARVTDGSGFVATGADGRYTIDITPDPTLPYLPSRTVSVCWPDGTWPERDEATGRWKWWARLMDIREPTNTHFRLVTRKAELPLCISYGTDPHDAFERSFNNIWPDEVRQAGDHVDFSVGGGDLWYIGFDNAEAGYAKIETFTRAFPGTLLQTIGNHDVVAVEGHGYNAPHELAGQGGFTKYLGPVRWSFDMAGVRFIGANWPMIEASGRRWLDDDLASLAAGRPAYLFVHMWSPEIGEIVQKYPAVALVLCGHSHRNIYAFREGGADFWTKMSLYTLLYVDSSGYDFVDRCIYQGGRNGWDGTWAHEGRGCALVHEWPQGNPQSFTNRHVALTNITLKSQARDIPTVPGSTYDIRVGARGAGAPAARWGVRITGTNGTPYELKYDAARRMLNLMGRETPFDPALSPSQGGFTNAAEQAWIEMRILVQPDRVRVLVNNRVGYDRFLPGLPVPGGSYQSQQAPPPEPGRLTGLPAARIEIFTEGGDAEFGRVDVWERPFPADYKPRRTGNTG